MAPNDSMETEDQPQMPHDEEITLVRDFPFRTRESEEYEEPEGPYKRLALELFGETRERTSTMVKELRERVEEGGYAVPKTDAFMVKILRAGEE